MITRTVCLYELNFICPWCCPLPCIMALLFSPFLLSSPKFFPPAAIGQRKFLLILLTKQASSSLICVTLMHSIYIQTKPNASLINYVYTLQTSLFLEVFLLIQQTLSSSLNKAFSTSYTSALLCLIINQKLLRY